MKTFFIDLSTTPFSSGYVNGEFQVEQILPSPRQAPGVLAEVSKVTASIARNLGNFFMFFRHLTDDILTIVILIMLIVIYINLVTMGGIPLFPIPQIGEKCGLVQKYSENVSRR